jgi:hypothetical protein
LKPPAGDILTVGSGAGSDYVLPGFVRFVVRLRSHRDHLFHGEFFPNVE